jgi:hypothetical protein
MIQRTWKSLAAAFVFVVAVYTQAGEPVSNRLITEVTDVSDDFRQEVRLASLTIPNNVWQSVTQSGWRVRIAEFVIDAAPSLSDQRPRGWPSDATWNNSDAVHLPQAKLLVLAEKRRTTSGRVVTCSRVPGVFRHEFGHAFDISLGGRDRARSATPEFVASYRADVEMLNQVQRKQMAYYLQNQRAGRQEAFAEAFAILLGGGSDTTKREGFSISFPRVLRYVGQEIRPDETVQR